MTIDSSYPMVTPAQVGTTALPQLAERLNANCYCISLDPALLRQALASAVGTPDLFALLEERCPHLFSAQPIFMSESQSQRMAALVHAVESVIAMPSYQALVLARAPAIARHDPGGARGVFFGYDFHLRDGGIGVIEINTNAGGAMLNAVMARAHRVCCLDRLQAASADNAGQAFEQAIIEMFQNEWRLSGKTGPLRTIAIVDVNPEDQYLYPEFILFQRLFAHHGIASVIADPSQLVLRDGVMWVGDVAIDLVYNRLTDFMLELPDSAALRAAYLAHAVVVTPHPQAHALYADKRNLAILGDAEQLRALGVPQDVQHVLLQSMLHTEVVSPSNADRLWSARRQLFFKPTAGYGGRAAYRGDKLTKRVWEDILAGSYIAQALMLPGQRMTGTPEDATPLKFDIRCYTYGNATQWTTARLYQGQTTNFRTQGGGFAPVYALPDAKFNQELDGIEAPRANAGDCCTNDCAGE